jgi:hypothetical protein
MLTLQEEVDNKFRDVHNILSAQQVALEIVANVCCSDGKLCREIGEMSSVKSSPLWTSCVCNISVPFDEYTKSRKLMEKVFEQKNSVAVMGLQCYCLF